MHIEQLIASLPFDSEGIQDHSRKIVRYSPEMQQIIKKVLHWMERNNAKVVQVSGFMHEDFGRVIHLWVSNEKNKPLGWSELQRVKNKVMGPDVLAIQVFPKESSKVDAANMYHLWCLPDASLGFNDGNFIC